MVRILPDLLSLFSPGNAAYIPGWTSRTGMWLGPSAWLSTIRVLVVTVNAGGLAVDTDERAVQQH